MGELVGLSLDQLITELQKIRRAIGHDVPVRYADGYDNAFPIFSAEQTQDAHWEGEPKGLYAAIS